MAGRPKSEKLPAKAYVEFTAARKAVYLKNIEEQGTHYIAAALAGVSFDTVQNHRKSDPEFKRLEEEAKQRNTDMFIAEAQRRAVKGVKKPLIGGQYKDEIVAYEQVYSDSLMSLVLKSRRTEFSPGLEGGPGGPGGSGGSGGGIMIVPAHYFTMDDWEKEQGEAAKGQLGRPVK